ncbi:hypothetical protein [Anaerotignum lactatifermentans]|uniref:hypothetical protein n=1 Tax=Anaerotignum lactatifermentans TaxID=160404 RepID=UPI001748C88D|nr:hypothetical protein [Anaerotignum lactatifermentans]HJE92578.1 hypothetical protein [Anaerotignum lactatifermentans]
MEQILVKIVKGVYGFDTGKTVVGKSAKDAPFLLDEDKARHLFDLGVAEPVCDGAYPDSSVYAVEENAEMDEGMDEIPTEDMEELNLAEMTLEELKEFAEPYGLKYKVGTKKADFIQQIREALEEKAHEEPPSFDASEAVQ